jgi:hypothetical protein
MFFAIFDVSAAIKVYIMISWTGKSCSHTVILLVKTLQVPIDQLTGTVPGKPVVDEPALYFQ